MSTIDHLGFFQCPTPLSFLYRKNNKEWVNVSLALADTMLVIHYPYLSVALKCYDLIKRLVLRLIDGKWSVQKSWYFQCDNWVQSHFLEKKHSFRKDINVGIKWFANSHILENAAAFPFLLWDRKVFDEKQLPKKILDYLGKGENHFYRYLKKSYFCFYGVYSGPLFEELIFRGVLQGWIEKRQIGWALKKEAPFAKLVRMITFTPLQANSFWQRSFRVLTVGVVFGLCHLSSVHSRMFNILIFVLITISGICYSIAKEKTSRLVAGQFMHIVTNAIALLSYALDNM